MRIHVCVGLILRLRCLAFAVGVRRRPSPLLLPPGPVEAARTSYADVSFVHRSATLWWPADRAWFIATEVDFAWTYVGGTRALIDALLYPLQAFLHDLRVMDTTLSGTAMLKPMWESSFVRLGVSKFGQLSVLEDSAACVRL